MPKRIQRKRTKGWRMPEGAVYIGRPTVWGNPFPLWLGRDRSIRLYRDMINGIFDPGNLSDLSDDAFHRLNEARQRFFTRLGGHPRYCLPELWGRDLVCWCPLDERCHADVLLELANK